MRLRVMKKILEENVECLSVQRKDLGGSKYEITNYRDLYFAIQNTAELGIIPSEFKKLEDLSFFHDKSQKIIIDSGSLNQLITIVNSINEQVVTVILAIKKAIPEQNENSVSIKLPEYNDLNSVSVFIKKIDTILKQTLVGKYKGNIKFQNFDTGSSWLEIILENKEAITFLAAFVYKATEFTIKNYLQWKQAEKMIESSVGIEVKAREQVLKSLENTVQQQSHHFASIQMKEFDISEGDQEYHTQLSHSIMEMAELLTQGTEVHPALDAPQEIQESFPNVEQTIPLIENALQLITGNTVNDDGNQKEE